MREFNLRSGDPLSLTISADARFTRTNYLDDQVWRLSLTGGEPAALSLETTYGFRTRSMRLFPRFVEGHITLTDPDRFASSPVIRKFLPNYIQIVFSPFNDIDVTMDYWAVHSDAIAGRIHTANHDNKPRQIRLEWAALLNSAEGNQMMTAEYLDSVPLLVGGTDDFVPLVFITGGALAISSPFPALALDLDLAPGKSHVVSWCHAASNTRESSFEKTQHIIQRNWDAEFARLELLNSGWVEIYTGDPDLDAALAFSQKAALNLFHSPDDSLLHPIFVSARGPDNGYSFRSDRSVNGSIWNGQTPLESYYIANILLPVAPDLIQGLILNYISFQNKHGEIDLMPDLTGTHATRLATPILANLSWRIFQYTQDSGFLDQVYEPLKNFFFSWFSSDHDRDEDGIPEWDHPNQTGIDDHPIFSRWQPWALGVDITTAESPSLNAFLYKESQSLIQMARELGRHSDKDALTHKAEKLRSAVETTWNEYSSSYQYRDRDTHLSPKPQTLGERHGDGVIEIRRDFEEPVRPVVRVTASHETTRRPQIFIHGTSTLGSHRVENIASDRLLWFPGLGTSTSEKAYARIDYIEISGLDAEDRVQIQSAGLTTQDITNLLPLWAGIPTPNRARKSTQKTLTNPRRYWQEYGFPTCPSNSRQPETQHYQKINLPICLLIGEGLLAYGYRKEAAELVSRLMKAIVHSLKNESGFQQQYHAVSGQGFGEWNALTGLAPLGLFLDTLGVHLSSQFLVYLEGSNPFPWPVTVKYRGMTILRGHDKTQIVFPDGQAVTIETTEPQIITLE